ncbi:hypothetical protein RHMOL_Rhmol04G0177100 [Rhododendron molle]|uniref:Uncharacterized protein n=1 Tax=Rhododendron molle TaxID=49168 RepID=A0ACC0P418_RHOML|nr:hypothetical protein RHMOL_Rhmol04G0177100 [Rhododendron molle]
MTMTPLDFSVITGLRVGGDLMPYDATTGRSAEFQRLLLGYVLRAEKEDAQYAQLLDLWKEPPKRRVEEEQMTRCFLLYMLGASLFPNRRNRVHLSFLSALRNVGEIARFDWGRIALGLWTYEVLGTYPPKTTCPDDAILPRALRLSKEYRGVKKGKAI